MRNGAPKKLIIFFSKGGGGHVAAAEAITGYLNGRYEITAVNIFTDILASLDPVRLFSFGRFGGEDMYNCCLARGWYGLINIYALKFGSSYIYSVSPRVKRRIKRYLERERPDLLISVIPFINAPLSEAAGELGIPLVIVPVDLDATTYIAGMNGKQHDHLFFCLAHDSAEIRATIAPASLKPEQIRITGYPVRQSFIAPVDPKRVNEEFALSNGKPTVFMLMGAAGASRALTFVREIEKICLPVQMVIGTGRNRKLYDRLCDLPSPAHITRRITGFTTKISDLMGVADFMVTKSGPSTIFEAIHRELPMVVDATTRPIHWEKMNISFIEEHGFGSVTWRIGDLSHVVAQHLLDDAFRSKIRRRFASFEKKVFREEFPKLVCEIV